MRKENYDISRQMQRDVINAYKEVYAKCFTQREAYERTVLQPAPRYYVTPKQALQVISPMMKGDFEMVDMMMPLRREMYYSLFNEVMKLSEKREFIGKSLSHVMRFAVLQPAPRFYIGWDRAKRIRIWLRKGYFDETGKVRDDKVKCYRTKREQYRLKKQWMLERALEREKQTEQ